MALFLTDAITRTLHRRKRDRGLASAPSWPTAEAKLLKPVIVAKDELAEGTAAQDSQIEVPFYFTLEGSGPNTGFFGGHLRTTPVSYSEASRLLPQIAEGALVRVRYNPENPDESHVLAADNAAGLSFAVWSN